MRLRHRGKGSGMSRWTGVVGVALALGIAGCGGGGDGPSSTAQTTADQHVKEARAAASDYATALDGFAQHLQQAGHDDKRLAKAAADPPQLRPVDSDDPAYVEAQATAKAVTTTARELRLVAQQSSHHAAKLGFQQYDIGSDHWQEAFDNDNRRYDRLSDILYADDGGFADTTHRDDLKVQRIWRAGVRQEIASFKRARARMNRLKTRNALERSFVQYALDEYDRSIAVLREFGKQLKQPPDRDQMGYYTQLAASQNGYHDVANAASRHQDGLERGFVRTVRRLAGGQDAAPGDAYRTAIVSGFISPLKKDKKKTRAGMVDERGWMLFRISQIEQTPPEAYDAARAELQLENIDDARNAYTGALEVYKQEDLATDPKGNRLPLIPAYRTWAHMKLTQPFPPLLQPMVKRMDALIAQYPSTTNWDKVIKTSKQIEQALRKGAKAADDPKQLKAALKDALDAMRQPPSAT
jgi:hypothetical protein